MNSPKGITSGVTPVGTGRVGMASPKPSARTAVGTARTAESGAPGTGETGRTAAIDGHGATGRVDGSTARSKMSARSKGTARTISTHFGALQATLPPPREDIFEVFPELHASVNERWSELLDLFANSRWVTAGVVCRCAGVMSYFECAVLLYCCA